MMVSDRVQPWTIHAVERVQKEAVTYDRLVTEMAALVPPGRAFREAQRSLLTGRRVRGNTNTDVEPKDEETRLARIRSGQRSIATTAVGKLIRSQRLETFIGPDGIAMVKGGPAVDRLARPPSNRPDTTSERSKAFLRAVADGPVKAEAIVEALRYTVPRQWAIEKVRTDRERQRVQHHAKNPGASTIRRPTFTEEEDYRMGARRIVHHNLQTMCRYGRISTTGTGADRMISKGPRWYDPDATTS